MPDKTLKEKVERASLDLSGIEVHYPHIDLFNIREALTALEERVKELERGYVKYSIVHPGEPAAGFLPYADEVTVSLDSGDPGGDKGDFEDWMREALSEWYDGAKVTIIKEARDAEE